MCKTETCNNLCIKEEQGEQRLMFSNCDMMVDFLYRAPKHANPCLSACIHGCTLKENLR